MEEDKMYIEERLKKIEKELEQTNKKLDLLLEVLDIVCDKCNRTWTQLSLIRQENSRRRWNHKNFN